MNINIKEVAKVARTSVATVSRVLNNTAVVTPALKARVEEAIANLGYIPNANARALSLSQTGVLGIVLPDMYGEFFSEFLRGADISAREQGSCVLVSSMHGRIEETQEIITALYGRVDGLVIMMPQTNHTIVTQKITKKLPTVWVNSNYLSDIEYSISIHNKTATEGLLRHLINKGCKKIAFITGTEYNSDAQERLQGYTDYLSTQGTYDERMIYAGDFTEKGGYEAVKRMIKEKISFDAVFAANDMMALGGLYALREHGLRVPQDIKMVGFDNIPLARYASPPLTTANIDSYALGYEAVRLLSDVIAEREVPSNKKKIVFEPQLVIRESS